LKRSNSSLLYTLILMDWPDDNAIVKTNFGLNMSYRKNPQHGKAQSYDLINFRIAQHGELRCGAIQLSLLHPTHCII
jgi:hypothetical protein